MYNQLVSWFTGKSDGKIKKINKKTGKKAKFTIFKKAKSPKGKQSSAGLSKVSAKSMFDPSKCVPVRVNVYALEKVNQKIKFTGCGVFHSGVEVYDQEWAYGGHPYDLSGIFQMVKPRDLKSLSDIEGSFKFSQTLRIGYTECSLQQVKSLLDRMAVNWKGKQYHLLNKNCNDFANKLCLALCGRGIPDWINRGATMMSFFPFVVKLIPKEYLTPHALQNQLKARQNRAAEEAKSTVSSSTKDAAKSSASFKTGFPSQAPEDNVKSGHPNSAVGMAKVDLKEENHIPEVVEQQKLENEEEEAETEQ